MYYGNMRYGSNISTMLQESYNDVKQNINLLRKRDLLDKDPSYISTIIDGLMEKYWLQPLIFQNPVITEVEAVEDGTVCYFDKIEITITNNSYLQKAKEILPKKYADGLSHMLEWGKDSIRAFVKRPNTKDEIDAIINKLKIYLILGNEEIQRASTILRHNTSLYLDERISLLKSM